MRLSLFALKKLQLDEVWWLVSPQNPLKPVTGMAPFTTRLAGAKAVAQHPKVRVSDLETRAQTRYTVDTMDWLHRRNAGTRFVWLMGADNLAQLHRWHRWHALVQTVLIAVVDRPGHTYAALSSPAATAMRRYRFFGLPQRFAAEPSPAWIFLFGFRDWTSATALRKGQANA